MKLTAINRRLLAEAGTAERPIPIERISGKPLLHLTKDGQLIIAVKQESGPQFYSSPLKHVKIGKQFGNYGEYNTVVFHTVTGSYYGLTSNYEGDDQKITNKELATIKHYKVPIGHTSTDRRDLTRDTDFETYMTHFINRGTYVYLQLRDAMMEMFGPAGRDAMHYLHQDSRALSDYVRWLTMLRQGLVSDFEDALRDNSKTASALQVQYLILRLFAEPTADYLEKHFKLPRQHKMTVKQRLQERDKAKQQADAEKMKQRMQKHGFRSPFDATDSEKDMDVGRQAPVDHRQVVRDLIAELPEDVRTDAHPYLKQLSTHQDKRPAGLARYLLWHPQALADYLGHVKSAVAKGQTGRRALVAGMMGYLHKSGYLR